MLLSPGLGHHALSTVATARANGPPGAQPSLALASGTPHSSRTLPLWLLLLNLPGYSSFSLPRHFTSFLAAPPFCSLAARHLPCPQFRGGGSTEVQTRTPGCLLEPPCPLLSHKPKPCGLLTLPETALHPHSHPARPSPWHLSLTPWLPSPPIPPLQFDFHTPARVRSANHNSDPVAPLLKSFRKYFICLRE